MKRFALSALVLTALACPAFADDELADEVAPDTDSLVAEFVADEPGAPEEFENCEVASEDVCDVPEKDGDFGTDEPVDVTTMRDGYILTTMAGEESTDDGAIIYYNAMSSTGGGGGTDSASLTVNQLADEQRASLRLFSGRESNTENTGRASSLKELFTSRSKAEARAEARTSALSAGDRELARRKAEIDQLRDQALRTGDTALMARADAMAAAQTKGSVKARGFFGFGKK